MNTRIFGYTHATALIIAAMIGTGVFTSLGLQVQSIPSAPAVLLLWVLGGVSSLCGALAYAELGAALPRSGGEYHLLRSIYNPTLGFIAGVATLIAGLAAPIAVSAVAFAKYMQNFFSLPAPMYSIGIILLLTALHAGSTRLGAVLHSGVTYFNLALILLFIGAAFIAPSQAAPNLAFTPQDTQFVMSPSYAVAFVYVSYAYLGWNTSIYVMDEVTEPQKNLPRSVITGVIVVTALYVLLNYGFLKSASIQALAGKVDVGYIAAQTLFGARGATLMSALIALALLASVSSYIILGPRVWRVMGVDYPTNTVLRFVSSESRFGAGLWAFVAQAMIALVMVVTSTFDAILVYAGFLLNIFNLLAVVGVIILRFKQPALPRPYRVWGYPATPILFAIVSLWMTVYVFIERPVESAFVLLTFVGGYLLSLRNRSKA
jgi:APA family basic amino acid/polyamine antiporter